MWKLFTTLRPRREESFVKFQSFRMCRAWETVILHIQGWAEKGNKTVILPIQGWAEKGKKQGEILLYAAASDRPPPRGGYIYTLRFVLKYVKLSKYVEEDARNCGK